MSLDFSKLQAETLIMWGEIVQFQKHVCRTVSQNSMMWHTSKLVHESFFKNKETRVSWFYKIPLKDVENKIV